VCDRPTAEAMPKAIVEPDTTRDPPGVEECKTQTFALWAKRSCSECRCARSTRASTLATPSGERTCPSAIRKTDEAVASALESLR
jgi:hypothetical protein